jgi:hypothetical protein
MQHINNGQPKKELCSHTIVPAILDRTEVCSKNRPPTTNIDAKEQNVSNLEDWMGIILR